MVKPSLYIKSVLDITPELLCDIGCRALILDADNTLRAYRKVEPYEGVMDWVDDLKNAEIDLIVVSNNFESSVEPLAACLSLEYVSKALKPLPFGIISAVKRLHRNKSEVAIVGDQIFTDVIGGNLSGVKTILVRPIVLENGFLWRIRRKLERCIINCCVHGFNE